MKPKAFNALMGDPEGDQSQVSIDYRFTLINGEALQGTWRYCNVGKHNLVEIFVENGAEPVVVEVEEIITVRKIVPKAPIAKAPKRRSAK